MHYVIIKDGEKVRSCNSIMQAKAIVRHINGGVVRSIGKEVSIPPTKWRKFPDLRDTRVKPYISMG